jgi:transcription initiation factor TFIIA large subunit
MSNTAVGAVYQTIIEEVINSSRVDFEESGVEESVLEELRKVSLFSHFSFSFSFCPPPSGAFSRWPGLSQSDRSSVACSLASPSQPTRSTKCGDGGAEVLRRV